MLRSLNVLKRVRRTATTGTRRASVACTAGVGVRRSSTLRSSSLDMRITALHAAYRKGQLHPSDVLQESVLRLKQQESNKAFICQVPKQHVLARAKEQDQLLHDTKYQEDNLNRLFQRFPLFGVPFSVKDNIDVAGFPTTAACPGFAYSPWQSATVVTKTQDAGAILVGKNNMDQFAAGLVGVRSPYGVPENPFNRDYCPGGSSAGSAVAVSTAAVSFSFGTDTAGSGRVPAAFNNIVGLKPTRGLISTAGVVPACHSLDCMSVFATTCEDAWRVFQATQGHDPKDVYARHDRSPVNQLQQWKRRQKEGSSSKAFRFGRPAGSGLAFFGDVSGADTLYHDSLKVLSQQVAPGSQIQDMDFSPFVEVARQLYEGPWTAERLSAIESFYTSTPDALHPVTRGIMKHGSSFSATDVFKAFGRMSGLRHQANHAWREADIDVLVVPTASITPTIQEVLDSPVSVNTILGYYTNFCNLLDLSVLSLPNGFLHNGMPSGISLIAPALHDQLLYRLGQSFQACCDLPLGATDQQLMEAHVVFDPEAFDREQVINANPSNSEAPQSTVEVAVCGAHMSGMSLNQQLLGLSAELVASTFTAPEYRLYDITHADPPTGVGTQERKAPIARPGLVRQAAETCRDGQGRAVEVEVWKMTEEALGRFVARHVHAPLSMGSVKLQDGRTVRGFVCEPHALQHPKTQDITSFGSWRAYTETHGK